jgi:hypothetical protein
MTIAINVTWHNANPNTILGKLMTRLGREPTHEEAKAEVQRILEEKTIELAGQGKLRHQRGWIA